MSDTEQRIRTRAYQLWEQAGRPHEHSEEFWFAARREIEGDVPPVGDRPGGAIDFPPESTTLEEPPAAAGAPAETPAQGAPPVRAARAVGTPAARKSASPDEVPAAGLKRGKPRPGKR